MDNMYIVVALAVGLLVGIIITRLMTPEYQKQKQLQKELEDAKIELEQHKQNLTEHFAGAAEMMDTLGKNYTKLYQHMAQNSAELLPTLSIQDNPFMLTSEAKQNDDQNADQEIPETQPKDYANGASGILKDEKPEVVAPTDSTKTS